MSLLIVIVNYRTSELALDCLRSLREEVSAVAGVRAIVIDNASGDDSVARLEAAVRSNGWDGWVTIRSLEENSGFAAGNNAAIRPMLTQTVPPRFILLLNPDTIVHPGALQALVAFMEARPDVGIAGSRLEELDGTPRRSGFRFPSVLGELEGGLRLGLASRLLTRWVVAQEMPT
jgi:N-acetylglucosaminyl-diphospho-decaprenol L-rhamnosyltransferase